jgi:hypothetical protein
MDFAVVAGDVDGTNGAGPGHSGALGRLGFRHGLSQRTPWNAPPCSIARFMPARASCVIWSITRQLHRQRHPGVLSRH